MPFNEAAINFLPPKYHKFPNALRSASVKSLCGEEMLANGGQEGERSERETTDREDAELQRQWFAFSFQTKSVTWFLCGRTAASVCVSCSRSSASACQTPAKNDSDWNFSRWFWEDSDWKSLLACSGGRRHTHGHVFFCPSSEFLENWLIFKTL